MRGNEGWGSKETTSEKRRRGGRREEEVHISGVVLPWVRANVSREEKSRKDQGRYLDPVEVWLL